MALKKKLQNSAKTKEYLNSLQRVYLVATWAKTGVWEFTFSGEYQFDKYAQCEVPLVYQYDDCNGTDDAYFLRPITMTTTGFIVGWTFDKDEAKVLAAKENARR